MSSSVALSSVVIPDTNFVGVEDCGDTCSAAPSGYGGYDVPQFFVELVEEVRV